jgi:hypothetical protein
MDWTEILARGGVAEPPGREAALRRMKELRPFTATLRSRSTQLLKTVRVEALDYSDALMKTRGLLAGHTLVRLAEGWA